MRAELERDRDGLNDEVCWTRLSEYLSYVERQGTAQNVASFIGAGTLRANGWATTTARPRPPNWTTCEGWSPRRWPTGHWASPRR